MQKRIIEKIFISVAYAVRITLLLAMIGAFISNRWMVLFLSSLSLFLTFLPGLVQRNFHIYLPVEFDVAAVIFVYAALFLGDIRGYYVKFWWWDVLLHAAAGIVLGFAGFVIIYSLYEGKKVRASSGLMAVFSFCFALAMGALWEIAEFTIDFFFRTNMQRSGLVDTMWDLILDSVGAFVIAVLGYFYMRGKKTRVFDKALHRFVDTNPHLFK